MIIYKMLEIKNLTKKYNNIRVVDDVSFIVRPGEILGYLGPNGAGKSTTIKIITGIIKQSSGKILYNNIDINKNIIEFKKKIGYLPEQSELYTHLTGLEYLQLTGRLRLIEEKLLNQKIEAILEQFDMNINMHLPISSYSKGMKQKILITAAILHNPDIILFDEPLSGLDVSTTSIIKNIITKLSSMGKIIIYSSHILEVVEKLCTRVIILNKGKLIVDNSVNELKNTMNLPSLDTIFEQLVENKDVSLISDRIVKITSLESIV